MDCVDMNASSFGFALRGLDDMLRVATAASDKTAGAGDANDISDPAACARESFIEKPAAY